MTDILGFFGVLGVFLLCPFLQAALDWYIAERDRRDYAEFRKQEDRRRDRQ